MLSTQCLLRALTKLLEPEQVQVPNQGCTVSDLDYAAKARSCRLFPSVSRRSKGSVEDLVELASGGCCPRIPLSS
jgi:ABC-type cobalamin/Fe3+-siderophores transport system ATPase subunit